MKIILISGKAEAGKTTTANMIKDILEKKDQPTCIVPYGQYVKDTALLQTVAQVADVARIQCGCATVAVV